MKIIILTLNIYNLHIINKNIASIEYNLYSKGTINIEPVRDGGGCGHDGYYSYCPYCKEPVGGYEGKNTSLKVDTTVYKCEKCGNFFRYS